MWTLAATASPKPSFGPAGDRPLPPKHHDVFKTAWDALRFPGMRFDIRAMVPPVPNLYPATAALCQTLATAEHSLWIDQSERSLLHQWCRYGTTARLVTSPAEADFTLVTHPSRLPPLYRLNIGDGADPSTATTLIIQLPALDSCRDMLWSSASAVAFPQESLEDLPPRFWQQRRELQEMLPWGIDILFIHGTSLFGLPRTVRVAANSLV